MSTNITRRSLFGMVSTAAVAGAMPSLFAPQSAQNAARPVQPPHHRTISRLHRPRLHLREPHDYCRYS
jgi:hypothetical protein